MPRWIVTRLSLVRGLLAALSVMAAAVCHADERIPANWDDQAGNPVRHNNAPRWRLDRLWPDDLNAPTGLRPLIWQSATKDWRDDDHQQGDLPSVRVSDSVLTLTAGGRWKDRGFVKAPAVTFIAPKAGVYGIAGKAQARVYTGRPPARLLVVHRQPDRARVLRTFEVPQDRQIELGGIGARLAAGEELVLIAVCPTDNSAAKLTVEEYHVSQTLADRDALQRVQSIAGVEPGTVNPNPSDEQLRQANAAVTGEGFVPPADSGALNVRAFGARGDGRTDDTDAIQAAYQRTGLIYFPNGTYLITRPIVAPPRRGSAPARRIIQGQSAQHTVIRLLDHAPGFGPDDEPRAVLVTSWGVAQAFRNAVRDLTIDVGRGNPNAIGLEFFASNTGHVSNVTLRASDPASGRTGLLLRGDNGPLLVEQLTVEGFDVGVHAAANQSATFDGVSLRAQRTVGLRSANKTWLRGLVSDNAVTAVEALSHPLVLWDAQLRGPGDGAALRLGRAWAYLRNLNAEGYASVVAGRDDVGTHGTVDRWISQPIQTLRPLSSDPLQLTPPPTPEAALDPPGDWVSVRDFPVDEITIEHKGTWRIPNWSTALQRAIDSGATTIYFPAGGPYTMTGDVVIRGPVRRIIGMEQAFDVVKTRGGARLVIEGDGPPLVIERMDTMYAGLHVLHRGRRPVVMRHMFADKVVTEAGAGDLFLRDFYTHFMDIQQSRVWATQFNAEHGFDPRQDPQPRPNIRNDGGALWVFGLKTEQSRTKLHARAGAQSEVVAYILANIASNPLPLFINEDSSIALTIDEVIIRNAPFEVVLRSIHDGQVLELPGSRTPASVPLLVD